MQTWEKTPGKEHHLICFNICYIKYTLILNLFYFTLFGLWYRKIPPSLWIQYATESSVALCLLFAVEFILDFQQKEYRDIVLSGMALCEYAAQVDGQCRAGGEKARQPSMHINPKMWQGHKKSTEVFWRWFCGLNSKDWGRISSRQSGYALTQRSLEMWMR